LWLSRGLGDFLNGARTKILAVLITLASNNSQVPEVILILLLKLGGLGSRASVLVV
jgi:hypothetical protein